MNDPIGIIDSGVGGLSVLGALRARLPNASYVYVSDASGRWGSLSRAAVLSRVRLCVQRLLCERCRLIVLACNTATSVCIDALRTATDVPIVGMEPALKPARESFPQGRILLLCTPATARTPRVRRLVARYGMPHCVTVSPPDLAQDVETHFLHLDALNATVERLLRENPADAVVLGCTHYVFLRPAFARILGENAVFDGTQGAVSRVQRLLAAQNETAAPDLDPTVKFCTV